MVTKRNILAVFMALFFFTGLYVFAYEPRYQGQIEKGESILVFAHRGFGDHAPDNSLIGARMALRQGLDGVDVDAQLTKDNEIVIFHDVSVERFTRGEGRVDAKTLVELREYDLAEKYGKGFSDVRIATFTEFVDEVVHQGILMVELKVASAKDTSIEQSVVDILEEKDAFERVYISSFNPIVLWRLKQIDSRVRTVLIFKDSGWDTDRIAATKPEDRVKLPWYLRNEFTRRAIRKLVRPDALSINKDVDERTIETLHKAGYPIFIWSVNEESEIQEALVKNPYGIISDEPVRARSVRDEIEN